MIKRALRSTRGASPEIAPAPTAAASHTLRVPYRVLIVGTRHLADIAGRLLSAAAAGEITLLGVLPRPYDLTLSTPSALGDFKLLTPSDLAAAAPDFMIKADDDPAPLPQAQTIVSPAQLLTYRQIAWPTAFDFRFYVSLLCRPLYLSCKEQGELSQGAARFILESQFAALAPYPLHIDEPYTFNEKIQWYKLHYRNPLMTVCADKLRLREYARDTLGTEAASKLFPNLLGAWERADDIDFAALPESFVLKVNHGNAQNILVRAKQDQDLKATCEQLNTWLKPEHNHYYAALEWCYKDIKPAILCEEFLELGRDLPDYKFFCFHGEPRLFYIAQNRFGPGGTQMDFYDLKGDHLPFTRLYPNAPVPPKKPQHLDRMLDIARALARPFPCVRVDFFDTPQGPLLGELTFYPGNGTEFFDPTDWDYSLGDLLTLPIPGLPTAPRNGSYSP